MFRARRRVIGDDGGPSLEILAMLEGSPTELIRFDLFDRDPHFHSPASDPMPSPLCDLPHRGDSEGPAKGGTVARVIEELPDQLGPLLERAGHAALARSVDIRSLRSGRTRLLGLLGDLPPPEDFRDYPLTEELRHQLGFPPGEER